MKKDEKLISKGTFKEISSLMKTSRKWEDIAGNLSKEAKFDLDTIVFEKKLNQCLEVIDILNKEKIDYVVLKGITLAYSNKKRFFGDLDIFVKPQQINKALKILEKKLNYKVADFEKK